MEKQNQFYPELEGNGAQQAAELMVRFEESMKKAVIKIIEDYSTDFYTKYIPHIQSDAWSNYRLSILNTLKNYPAVKADFPYDAQSIRKAIYENHKQEIVNDLNQDLLKEIEELKIQLKKAYQL
jgi:NADPH-dependent 7-cyano-7-deazaguanine reductase QueF-like protein